MNLSKVFNKLKQAEVITHYWHLNTNGIGGEALHEALGDFYEGMQGLADSLAEAYMGRFDEYLDIPPAIMLNVGEDKRAYLEEFGSFIDAQIKLTVSIPDIQDKLLDVRNAVNKLLYKMRMQ